MSAINSHFQTKASKFQTSALWVADGQQTFIRRQINTILHGLDKNPMSVYCLIETLMHKTFMYQACSSITVNMQFQR